MAEEKEEFGIVGCILYTVIILFAAVGCAVLIGYLSMAKGGVTAFNHHSGHIHGLASYGSYDEHYDLSDDSQRSELENGGLTVVEGHEV